MTNIDIIIRIEIDKESINEIITEINNIIVPEIKTDVID